MLHYILFIVLLHRNTVLEYCIVSHFVLLCYYASSNSYHDMLCYYLYFNMSCYVTFRLFQYVSRSPFYLSRFRYLLRCTWPGYVSFQYTMLFASPFKHTRAHVITHLVVRSCRITQPGHCGSVRTRTLHRIIQLSAAFWLQQAGAGTQTQLIDPPSPLPGPAGCMALALR